MVTWTPSPLVVPIEEPPIVVVLQVTRSAPLVGPAFHASHAYGDVDASVTACVGVRLVEVAPKGVAGVTTTRLALAMASWEPFVMTVVATTVTVPLGFSIPSSSLAMTIDLLGRTTIDGPRLA